MRQSQEREDEEETSELIEYSVHQVAPPESRLPPPTWHDYVWIYAILLIFGLLMWLLVRGFYLAGRELVQWL
jgi:hypothetical protein